MVDQVEILGCPVNRLTLDQTLERCEQLVKSGGPAQHVCINASKIVAMHDDPELRRIIESCALVSADGMSIVWASRVLGKALPGRVAGIDLMHELLEAAERNGWRVFILGAEAKVLEMAVRRLEEAHPRLEICGYHDGYFSADEDHMIAAGIREARPDVLFVAMSSPKKEYWVAEHLEQLAVPFVMGIGGALDVVAGKTRRAPLALRRAGLEWAYRLAQEPRRLGGRYTVTNARFLLCLARDLMGRAGGTGES